jgi:transcriptional regulator
MYRPAHYAQDDFGVLREIIRKRSFAVIATVANGAPEFAYAPTVFIDDASPRGGVQFHLARANPMSRLDGRMVRMTFLGPDAYVSPDWYGHGGFVPTWNYIAVEGAGVARELDNDGLRALLVALSAEHEKKLAPKPQWTLDKLDEKRLGALLNAIVGFSVSFETLEGKFKLSQDKKSPEFEGALQGLEAQSDCSSRAVANAMLRYGKRQK